MANLYADLSPKLLAIKERLWDLLPVIRDNVYYPEFEGSFSIKAVAPVLAPDVSYAALVSVAEGSGASAAFIRIATSAFMEGETEGELRFALLSYCKLDTLAMVRVYQKLVSLAYR